MHRNIWNSIVLLFLFTSCQPSSEELFEAAIGALENEDFDTAIDYLDRLVEKDTAHASAWNARGVIFFQTGKWDEAIDSFSRSIELDENNYKPFFNRGNVYMEKEEFKNALIDYNRANGLDLNQMDIYYNRGLALLGLEMYEDALIDFDKALMADPQQPQVLFNKAKALLGNNDPLTAIATLEELTKIDKRNGAAYYLLGVTEMSALGKKEEGCTYLNTALSLGYTQAKDWIDEFCDK
jgi:tetratricopeptide (TPR) repeat protein